MNLAGIDLLGANLSKTDLRGTNFTRAQLMGREFAYAKTGTRRLWMAPIVLVALVALGLTSPLLGVMVAWLFLALLSSADDPIGAGSDLGSLIAGVVGLVTLVISTFIYYRQGILAALGVVAFAFAVSRAVAGAGAGAVTFSVAFSELQDLLKPLQTAIETDADLSDTDKTGALEQVEKLAEAGKDPQTNQSRAKRAIGVIKDITQGLTETNKLVDVCKTLLPAIGMLFAL